MKTAFIIAGILAAISLMFFSFAGREFRKPYTPSNGNPLEGAFDGCFAWVLGIAFAIAAVIAAVVGAVEWGFQ